MHTNNEFSAEQNSDSELRCEQNNKKTIELDPSGF